MNGQVYLIHLENAIAGRASHYIGWASNVPARLWHHRHNRGSRFLQVANELGIAYKLVRIWNGGKDLERLLKNRKNARRLCPCCNPKQAQHLVTE